MNIHNLKDELADNKMIIRQKAMKMRISQKSNKGNPSIIETNYYNKRSSTCDQGRN